MTAPRRGISLLVGQLIKARWATIAKTATRERIVLAAAGLFQAQGYASTSLAQIAESAGANPGSVYYFFRSKDAILLAVLDWYLENLWPEVIAPVFEAVTDPVERVFGILASYRRMLVVTGCTLGCPIGNLALEVADHLPEARSKIAANFAQWTDAVRRCLVEAGDTLAPDADRPAIAGFVLTVMEGAVMQARVSRSLAPFDDAVAVLRDYFARLRNDKNTTRRAR